MSDDLAQQIRELQAPADEPLRSCAYYYSFDLTGVGIVDRILSAVARAGKAYHHTEDWSATDPKFQPKSHEALIQEAANEAAAAVRGLGTSVMASLEKAYNEGATADREWIAAHARLALLPGNPYRQVPAEPDYTAIAEGVHDDDEEEGAA